MNIEIENLKLKLIEAQMTILQYQHRDVLSAIQKLKNESAQKDFDKSVDDKDMPSGQTSPPDQFSGD